MNNMIEISKVDRKIKLYHIAERIDLPEHIQEKINDYWKIRLSDNVKLRRGRVFCIRNIIYNSDEVEINLVDTDYAHYLYTMNNVIEKKYACRVCFAVGLIMTSDNKYIIGQMNKDTSTPLRLQLPGGGLEEQDIINGNVCLENNLDRELKEEVGFGIADKKMVASSELKYIKQGGNCGFIAFIYKIKLKISSEEYRVYFKKYCNDLLNTPELCNVFFVDRDRKIVDQFFNNMQVPIVDYLYPVILTDLEEE